MLSTDPLVKAHMLDSFWIGFSTEWMGSVPKLGVGLRSGWKGVTQVRICKQGTDGTAIWNDDTGGFQYILLACGNPP